MSKYKYLLLDDHGQSKAGATVYPAAYHDYGLASDDTQYTGIRHVSVTLNEDGNYPTFTVPITKLKRIQLDIA